MIIPSLSFQAVTKRYGTRTVLDAVSLSVAPGECVALVGVNGAGKTSLLKCLFDFTAIAAGSIEISGVSHLKSVARQPLVYLPERFTPPAFLTGAEFLDYMFQLHGSRVDAARAAAMCDALALDRAALVTPVRSYSKGMAQKLGLAACLLVAKPVLVLDEPMSGLDPKARALLKVQLRALREAGSTVFFSSHELADVEALCDRLLILHEGRLRFAGSPAACRATFGGATLEQAFLHCID
jgi:ABC-2 type transport system ATP-binding protein